MADDISGERKVLRKTSPSAPWVISAMDDDCWKSRGSCTLECDCGPSVDILNIAYSGQKWKIGCDVKLVVEMKTLLFGYVVLL
jgi:hypothetical protein